jgi:uncharacterized protein (DUF58 family)
MPSSPAIGDRGEVTRGPRWQLPAERRAGGAAGDRAAFEPRSPRWRGRLEGHFPGFSLRATRGFWIYLAAVPLLGVAALNTGNNALYLLLSLSLGVFVASGWVSRHTLRHLTVRADVPSEIFCGAPVQLELTVRNGSGLFPAGGVVCTLVGMPGRVLVPVVPRRGVVRVRLATVFPRRGRHCLPAVRLEVRLPLPFFVKSSRFEQHEAGLLVFPRRVVGAAPRWAGVTLDRLESTAGAQRRHGEVDQLREFHPGDDLRDIHWKQTARQQRPIVMERRERAVPSRFLVLDRQLPRSDDALMLERFEDLVSEIASAAIAQVRRGEAVGLVLGGAVTPPATGARHARRLLEQLAVVRAVGPGEDPLPGRLGEGPVYRLVEGR